jgi:hypothetical protein
MYKTNYRIIYLSLITLVTIFSSCEDDKISDKMAGDADIITSFKVINKSGKEYRASIDENTVTIKVSPYLDPVEELAEATPVFYLSRGATVTPDPSIAQNFAQEGGVKYTVKSMNGKNTKVYTVSYGESDKLPYGSGFSYAEIGATKTFPELGYPGERANFNLPSIQYGDLYLCNSYCGKNSLVLFSRLYAENGDSEYAFRVYDKTTLDYTGKLNTGSIDVSKVLMITSDYYGTMVAAVDNGGTATDFYYWSSPSSAPVSMGSVPVSVNIGSSKDPCNNFQVVGDVTESAVITAAAPRSSAGNHYRFTVTSGKVASSYKTISTGYSSSDSNGFQMICPMGIEDNSPYLVGDAEGSGNNALKGYINTAAGSTTTIMPGLWQSTLQSWWVGTGQNLSRTGARRPLVSALPINGKTYICYVGGTAWWHAAAVLETDFSTLAHQNLNIAHSINCGWSYGCWMDWYWDKDAEEGYLSIWMARDAVYTYKMTCYE